MTCPCQGISKSSIQPIRFLAGAFASSPLHEERARIPVRAYNGNSVSRCLCPWRSRISGCVKSSGPCEPGLASKHWKIWLRRPKEARAHAHRASGRLAQSAGGAPPDDRRRYRRGLPGDEPWARSSSNRMIEPQGRRLCSSVDAAPGREQPGKPAAPIRATPARARTRVA